MWEEINAGMYKKIPTDQEEKSVSIALKVMINYNIWGEYMKRIVDEWFFSCQQNLSHKTHNRIAWLGQAAVCIATGMPEDITRKAWWRLSDRQRLNANEQAATAIRYWEKSNSLPSDSDKQIKLIFREG
jgi:acyl-coenzyme A synthetase/AMP-(fatty) acid ligase